MVEDPIARLSQLDVLEQIRDGINVGNAGGGTPATTRGQSQYNPSGGALTAGDFAYPAIGELRQTIVEVALWQGAGQPLITLKQPLTVAELRTTPVDVAGSFLTNTQLRASPVDVAISGGATAALQGTGNTTLASILAAGPALVAGNAITRVADTNAYLAGDLIGNSVTAPGAALITFGAARATNMPLQLRRTRLTVSGAASPWMNATVRMHFYNVSPVSAVGDNGIFQTPMAGYLGYMDILLNQQRSDGVCGSGVPDYGGEITTLPATGNSNIFGLMETRTSLTPASASIFTPSLEVWRG